MRGKCLTREKQTVQILGVSPKSHCLFSPSLLTFPLTAHACKTYCTCRKKSGLFCSRPQRQGKSIISPTIWNAVSGSYADFYLNLIPKHLFLSGVLLEAGTRVPAPVYSEHSTRLRRNRSQVDKYEIKSQTNRNFFSPLSCLARGV